MIEIRLLGGFSLDYDGKVIQSLGATRMQSLVAYLLLHRGITLTRLQLALLFWPDSSEAQAHTNLRKLLFQLGHALPEADRYIQLEGAGI
jgi:DNA-binding SARP family transcriptional activator